MSDKSCLCLWCGRFTESVAVDGLADCDRPECIAKRDYTDSDMTPDRKDQPTPMELIRDNVKVEFEDISEGL